MFTPCLSLIRRKYPRAKITVLTMFEGCKEILENNPNMDEVLCFEFLSKSKLVGLKYLLNLRKIKFDLSINPFPTFRREYNIISFTVGAKKRIAHKFNTGYISDLTFLNTDTINVNEKLHNIENNLNLLKLIDINYKDEIKKKDIKYNLILSKSNINFGKRFIENLKWSNQRIVGIHPGSTISPAAILRRWPVERYADIIKYLINVKKCKILIFTGPDETELGERLRNLMDDKDNDNCILIKNLKLKQTLGILNFVNFLVCNDNGFGHLAVALNKPIITLWASTNDKWSLPYNKKLVTLIRPKGFKPWYRYEMKRSVPSDCVGGMDIIKVGVVISKINKLMEGRKVGN